MSKQSDDIKAARDATSLKVVFADIAAANTDHFNATIEPEDILRTLITLTAEVQRLSDAVSLLQKTGSVAASADTVVVKG